METKVTFESLPSMVVQLTEQLNRIEKLLTKPCEHPKPLRVNFNGALDHINKSGHPLSKSKFQKLCAAGTVPCGRFNNHLIFDICDLDRWIEIQTTKANNESNPILILASSANKKSRRKQS